MVLKALIIAIIGFFVSPATAQTSSGGIEIESINDAYSRAEGELFDDLNATTTTIYGGLSGTCSGTLSSSSTCNSCTGVTTGPCNTRRVHDNLELEIRYTYPSGDAGPVLVTNDIDTGQTGQEDLSLVSFPSGNINSGSGVIVTIRVRWGEICDKLFGTDCDSITEFDTAALRVGIDSDRSGDFNSTSEFTNDLRIQVADIGAGDVDLCQEDSTTVGNGPCNFIVVAGDKKVFVEDVRAGSSFPSVEDSDADIRYIRVYSSADGTFPTIQTDGPKDLEVASNTGSTSGNTRAVTLVKNEVDGLTNGEQYHFAIAAVDEAGNVGFFTNMSGAIPGVTGTNDPDEENTTACFDPTGENSSGKNCHIATPDEVLALIEKDFDCFITTASFGSPFHSKVQDFRGFRNQFLHPTWLGRKLIKFYYRNSPPIAKWIENHPASKPVMRGFLYPFWLFAKVCLLYPLVTVTSLLLLLMGLLWHFGARRVR